MRGSTTRQIPMLSTLTPERLVPADHPLRRIKVIVDRALAELAKAPAHRRAILPPPGNRRGADPTILNHG
jgi:hypothetical protein